MILPCGSYWDHHNDFVRRELPLAQERFSAVIDVRQFIPAVKHQTIFGVWDALSPGCRLLLINDHDPKPLYYQLAAEYAGQFEWAYIEQGPVCWQVQIEKRAGGPS